MSSSGLQFFKAMPEASSERRAKPEHRLFEPEGIALKNCNPRVNKIQS